MLELGTALDAEGVPLSGMSGGLGLLGSISDELNRDNDETEEFRRDREKKFKEFREELELLGARMGDCNGVEAREFQIPSMLGSSSIALAPKGISSLDLIRSLISNLSMSPACAFVRSRILRDFCSFTKPAKQRTRTYIERLILLRISNIPLLPVRHQVPR